MKLLLLLATTTLLLAGTLSYKILVVAPVPSRSHNILGKGIVDSLLKARHEVTWVTPYPEKTPRDNLTIIDVSHVVQPINLDMMDPSLNVTLMNEFSKNISIGTIQTPALRQALVEKQFDAVVSEWFLSDSDAGYAAIQQVPWIMFFGSVMHPYIEHLVDEVRSLSTLPLIFNTFNLPMNFWNRLTNVFLYGVISGLIAFQRPEVTARYEELFTPLAAARGVELPPFQSALHNISVLLVTSHPSFTPAQSLPPNVVEIAGFHIDSNRPPLPKDIKDILDASPQGVVYFSLGTVVKSSALPDHLIQGLLKMLGDIPYTVLWKFEKELEGIPKNVHIRAWWPQASILAHPNIKLFMTHSGLLSTLEAIQIGVPMLAIPCYGDQPSNAERAVINGFARKVPYSTDMVPELTEALQDMLTDDRYYKQAKYLSKLFNTRPVHPRDLIPFYVELAIETKGAYHLRSKTYLYPWYQRWMLDIVAFILVIIYLISVVVNKLWRKLFSKKQNKVKKN